MTDTATTREIEAPKRIQLSRAKGWRMPPNTVKVDRTTVYGNDCTVEDYGSVEAAVDMFEHDLAKFSCFHPEDYAAWIAPLRGKNLACWCRLDRPCHADVLLEFANQSLVSEAATLRDQRAGESGASKEGRDG
jgi:hypothetical protein